MPLFLFIGEGVADIPTQQRADAVFFLGYPAKVLVPDSTHYNRIIYNRFIDIDQATVDRVDELITLIKETRTKLDNTRDDANVSQVGEIGIDPNLADHYISKQYKRYIRELSATLDVPVRNWTAGGRIMVRL